MLDIGHLECERGDHENIPGVAKARTIYGIYHNVDLQRQSIKLQREDNNSPPRVEARTTIEQCGSQPKAASIRSLHQPSHACLSCLYLMPSEAIIQRQREHHGAPTNTQNVRKRGSDLGQRGRFHHTTRHFPSAIDSGKPRLLNF